MLKVNNPIINVNILIYEKLILYDRKVIVIRIIFVENSILGIAKLLNITIKENIKLDNVR